MMLHAVEILLISQELASKICFDRNFEIKEVFMTASAE